MRTRIWYAQVFSYKQWVTIVWCEGNKKIYFCDKIGMERRKIRYNNTVYILVNCWVLPFSFYCFCSFSCAKLSIPYKRKCVHIKLMHLKRQKKLLWHSRQRKTFCFISWWFLTWFISPFSFFTDFFPYASQLRTPEDSSK